MLELRPFDRMELPGLPYSLPAILAGVAACVHTDQAPDGCGAEKGIAPFMTSTLASLPVQSRCASTPW